MFEGLAWLGAFFSEYSRFFLQWQSQPVMGGRSGRQKYLRDTSGVRLPMGVLPYSFAKYRDFRGQLTLTLELYRNT